jgi:hypothetical protein
MKSQNDYVNGPGVSSYVVTLRLKFSNGETAKCIYERYFDENEEKSLTFGDYTVYIGDDTYCYWLMDEELGLGIGELNLGAILAAAGPEELIRNLEAVFLIGEKTDEEYKEDDDWEPEPRMAEELARLTERKNGVVNAFHTSLTDNIRTVADVRQVSICLEVGGGGGYLDVIMRNVYGKENAKGIWKAITADEEKAKTLQVLRNMNCFVGVNEASLCRMIRYLRKHGGTPDCYMLEQTLKADGTVSLKFSTSAF